MEVQTALGLERRDGFTVVTIPYANPDIQLVILLPDKGQNLEGLESKLTPDLLDRIAQVPATQVRLFLPRFVIEATQVELRPLLQQLGMNRAFSGAADFSGMLARTRRKATEAIALSDVFHQTFVSVDEEGTEAAAATAVVIGKVVSDSEPPPPPPEVHVDHPFLFAIQHRPSGAALFLGRVSDPR
jgi:serpin B